MMCAKRDGANNYQNETLVASVDTAFAMANLRQKCAVNPIRRNARVDSGHYVV